MDEIKASLAQKLRAIQQERLLPKRGICGNLAALEVSKEEFALFMGLVGSWTACRKDSEGSADTDYPVSDLETYRIEKLEDRVWKNSDRWTLLHHCLSSIWDVKPMGISQLLNFMKEYQPLPMVGICGNLMLFNQSGMYNGNLFPYAWMQGSLYAYWGSKVFGHDPGMELTKDYPVGGAIEFARESAAHTIWKNPRRFALLEWLQQKAEAEGL